MLIASIVLCFLVDDQDELLADFTQYTDMDNDSISKYVRRRIAAGEREHGKDAIDEVRRHRIAAPPAFSQTAARYANISRPGMWSPKAWMG